MLGAIGREAVRDLGLVGAPADALGAPGATKRDVDALVAAPCGEFPWAPRLPVGALATDSVALASLAVEVLAAERYGREVTPIRVDRPTVAASFGSERVLRIDGEALSAWAPLSGFFEATDGWVRTHANYPHHERALRELLGIDADADKPAAARAIAGWSAIDLEARAAEVGAIVGAVRTAEQWASHPQGRDVAATPLIAWSRVGDGAPRTWEHSAPRDVAAAAAPLRGIRVLDLTRVIAGPVAARDLALAGAQVLRVDSPHLPETGWIHLDTGQGKRSTLLDLRHRDDLERFDALLESADVVVTGYRPGALARFGLDPAALAERHPGIVTASVSAWGVTGPWAQRRGFDSIVQAVSGVAMRESADGVTPGALPVQALDHATGHLLAAAIVTALAEQRRTGGSIDVRMSLARTAHALLTSPDAVEAPSGDPAPPPSRTRTFTGGALRSLTYAPPVLSFSGAPADYPEVGRAWGMDAAEWWPRP
jgi:crotonobetainyl-CoA:carnitine CoA-transferase CaiB-like acyl-CoA transferase